MKCYPWQVYEVNGPESIFDHVQKTVTKMSDQVPNSVTYDQILACAAADMGMTIEEYVAHLLQ